MGGKGGGGGEVRQGGIDLLPLYRGTRQVLSALPLPYLINRFPSSQVGLFPDLFDLGETARQSSPVSRLGLSPLPVPRSVFSLIFDFSANQAHSIPSTTRPTPVPCKIVVGRGGVGGLWCCIGVSRVK